MFFHLRVFRPSGQWSRPSVCENCATVCQWSESEPPPILGEAVQVELDTKSDRPRAAKVFRPEPPTPVSGEVETFDASRGYGFIRGEDERSYHLHRCEVTDGRMPLVGQKVMFFAGVRQGKPRACHVKIC